MKKALPIIIGLLVFAGLLGGYFVLKQNNEKAEKAEAEKDTVYSYDTADITELTFSNASGEVKLTKADDAWSCETQTDTAIDADKVSTLLDMVCELEIKKDLGKVDSLSDYGLETPSATITFTAADQTVSVAVGDFNDTSDSQYVYIDGDNEHVYAVSKNLGEFGTKTIADVTEDTTEDSTEE